MPEFAKHMMGQAQCIWRMITKCYAKLQGTEYELEPNELVMIIYGMRVLKK